VIALSRLAASQVPQSAGREEDGEDRGHADREERPDPEEFSAGVGDPAADKSHSPHMDVGNGRPKERRDENYDVPGSSSSEHQRCVQPDHHDKYPGVVPGSSRFEPADDVIRQVKRKEEDREQRRDG